MGEATVCVIVMEVCATIVQIMWDSEVYGLFPQTEEEFRDSMVAMEEHWQFPCSFAAIDGCHISVKCPPGSQESQKEHHNFKGSYSIVLMAIVDDLDSHGQAVVSLAITMTLQYFRPHIFTKKLLFETSYQKLLKMLSV